MKILNHILPLTKNTHSFPQQNSQSPQIKLEGSIEQQAYNSYPDVQRSLPSNYRCKFNNSRMQTSIEMKNVRESSHYFSSSKYISQSLVSLLFMFYSCDEVRICVVLCFDFYWIITREINNERGSSAATTWRLTLMFCRRYKSVVWLLNNEVLTLDPWGHPLCCGFATNEVVLSYFKCIHPRKSWVVSVGNAESG